MFVSRYFQKSSVSLYSGEVIGGLDPGNGYQVDDQGRCWPLYETQEEVNRRLNALKAAFLKCGCVRCDRMQCSCRRASRICLPTICQKCQNTCQNRDSSTAQHTQPQAEAASASASVLTLQTAPQQAHHSSVSGALAPESSAPDPDMDTSLCDLIEILDLDDESCVAQEVGLEGFSSRSFSAGVRV